MNQMLIPPAPGEPAQSQPVRPSMIYVKKQFVWEYKLITRNLESEQPLHEDELNILGEESWEMSGIAQQPPATFYYFKRQVEK